MPWSIEDKVAFYSRSIRGAHLPELGSRCTTKLTILSLKLGRRSIELHYGTVLGGRILTQFPAQPSNGKEKKRSPTMQFDKTPTESHTPNLGMALVLMVYFAVACSCSALITDLPGLDITGYKSF